MSRYIAVGVTRQPDLAGPMQPGKPQVAPVREWMDIHPDPDARGAEKRLLSDHFRPFAEQGWPPRSPDPPAW
jgi:hypothetical protein